MNYLSYTEYQHTVTEVCLANPSWRLGQSSFNTLQMLRPDLAEKVRGAALDPFYSDTNMQAFGVFVFENWDAA